MTIKNKLKLEMYLYVNYIPTSIYLFKVNNLKTITLCEICSKLANAISDNLLVLLSYFPEVYLEPSQTSIIECFRAKKKFYHRCFRVSYLRLSLF